MTEITTKERIEYLEFLKKNVVNMKFPPDYNGDLLYYNDKLVHYLTNCYFYAMQFRLNETILTNIRTKYLPLGICCDDFLPPDFVKVSGMDDEYPVLVGADSEFKFSPGFMSGEIPLIYRDSNELVDKVFSDLELLGLTYHLSDLYSPILYGGYKVAIMMNEEGRDIHFIRQNKDFTWSEKGSHRQGVRRVPSFLEDLYTNRVDEIVEVIEISKPKSLIL